RGRGGTDLGASYRLATEIGDTPRRVDASLRYDAAQATAQVDAVYADEEVTARGNLSGSVGLIDGRPALSPAVSAAPSAWSLYPAIPTSPFIWKTAKSAARMRMAICSCPA
ncbi:MAG: hypothetical protein ACR2QJ_16305, partial [Geminicoccaceae bacterium]